MPNHNLKQKSTKNHNFYLGFLFFCITVGFLFLGNIKTVTAEYCSCQCNDNQFNQLPGGSFFNQATCTSECAKTNCTGVLHANPIDQKKQEAANEKAANDRCPSRGAWYNPLNWVESGIIWLLEGILSLVGVLISLAGVVFTWIIDANVIKGVLTNTALYNIWTIVRDLLNIVFIMVLLFIAFATIFRIEKYNYKKMLITLVLMALLVNFSWPIILVIIDFSNVLMYTILRTFLNSAVNSNGSIFTDIASNANLNAILKPTCPSITSLIAAIIFSFMFAVTLLTIAFTLVVRIIVLAILMMFSPVAFVGAIIPSSKAENAVGAQMYWDNLFKYCFFGPIMVFMIFVATRLMGAMSTNNVTQNVKNLANGNSVEPTMLAAIMALSLPIIVLWLGLGIATKMGIAGAGWANKQAGRFARWGLGITFAHDAWQAYQKRRTQGDERSWSNRLGSEIGSRQDQAWAKVGGVAGMGKDAKQRYLTDQNKKVKEASERYNMENLGVNQLEQIRDTGNKFESAAAIEALQGKNAFDTTNITDPRAKNAYNKMRDAFGTDSHVFNTINNDVKKKDALTAFSHITDPAEFKARCKELVNSSAWDPSHMNFPASTDPAEIDRFSTLLETAFQEGTIDRKQIGDLRSKYNDDTHRKFLYSAMGQIANKDEYATYAGTPASGNKRMNREIQMAYTRITGELSVAAQKNETYGKSAYAYDPATYKDYKDGGMISEIYRSVNDDDMKKAKGTQARYWEEFIKNIPTGSLTAILPKLENKKLQHTYVMRARADARLERHMKSNPTLRGYK